MNGGEAPLSAQRKREHKKAFSRVEVGMEHVRSELRDNSFRAKRGDVFGQLGEEMLGGRHGKEFKKQKTKLKNKNFHGGSGRAISVAPTSTLL